MKLTQIPKKIALIAPAFVIILNIAFMGISSAAFTQGNIIDDQVFDNVSTMDAAAVNSFLNGFPNSCLSTNNGFTASDPIGYTPNGGYKYGAAVSAGQVITDAAKTYGINPQVLLTTLQKEEGMVKGDGPYGCSALAMSAAVGYACTDSDTASHTYTYTNGTDPGTLSTPLFFNHGTPVNSVTNTCVNSNLKAGFTEQIIRAAWLLKFGEQRAEGNLAWNVQLTNFPQQGDIWNNSDDPQSCYGGPMTAGTFKVCPTGSAVSYDGFVTIDGTSVQVQNGATAALYWYTPHFNGNQNFDLIFGNWFGSTSGCDFPNGSSAGLSNAYNNAGQTALAGNWVSATKQSFSYVTPNYNGGFDIAVMDPSNGTAQWQGTWWNQTNSGINQGNTIFIPARNSAGLTDLYYATSANWSRPGFTVGLMHNTGHGFTYQGTQWAEKSLSLASTKFIPGNFSPGGGAEGFAYATNNYTGGFDVAVMSASNNGLVWQGTKWSQLNGGINLGNTKFIPADSDGDGMTDLYYGSSTNWNKPGFTVGLMHDDNTIFTYGGSQWTNTNLSLGTTTFLPGNWTGGAAQGFAYITPCGSRGFDMSVMAPISGKLTWWGQWWHAGTLALANIDFVPADTDGDGYTDLFYATPNGNYGFSLALQHNSHSSNFVWQGILWSPTSIPLSTLQFLPSE
jgi:hypothetical protein